MNPSCAFRRAPFRTLAPRHGCARLNAGLPAPTDMCSSRPPGPVPRAGGQAAISRFGGGECSFPASERDMSCCLILTDSARSCRAYGVSPVRGRRRGPVRAGTCRRSGSRACRRRSAGRARRAPRGSSRPRCRRSSCRAPGRLVVDESVDPLRRDAELDRQLDVPRPERVDQCVDRAAGRLPDSLRDAVTVGDGDGVVVAQPR